MPPARSQFAKKLAEYTQEIPVSICTAFFALLFRLALILTLRFLYALTLSLDANFRLKLKDRGFSDIRLGTGRAYCVAESKFEKFLENNAFATEVRG